MLNAAINNNIDFGLLIPKCCIRMGRWFGSTPPAKYMTELVALILKYSKSYNQQWYYIEWMPRDKKSWLLILFTSYKYQQYFYGGILSSYSGSLALEQTTLTLILLINFTFLG